MQCIILRGKKKKKYSTFKCNMSKSASESAQIVIMESFTAFFSSPMVTSDVEEAYDHIEMELRFFVSWKDGPAKEVGPNQGAGCGGKANLR